MKLINSTNNGRLFVLLGMTGVIAASLSGCGGGNSPQLIVPGPNPPSPLSGPYSGRSVCTINTHQNGRARWTVLIYMQSGNNLQPFSLQNMAQIASVGSNSDLNIVVQWKQIPISITQNCPNCTPSFYGVRRYFIRQHSSSDIASILQGDTRPLNSDRLTDPPGDQPVNTAGFIDTLPDPQGHPNGTEDMGNYQSLADFVHWGTQNYPADNMILVIWDHGSGWVDAYRSAGRKAAARAVAQDDEFADEIETWQLPTALSSAVQPIDALLLDCSLEQMMEVAFEVRRSARIMVGSEESPPAPGYPYDKWLADLKRNSSVYSVCDLGDAVIHDFINDTAYVNDTTHNYASELTQSMIDLSEMNPLASALNTLGGVCNRHVQDQKALFYRLRQDPTFPNRSQGGAQHYTVNYRDNKDLWDYADLIRTGTSDSDLILAALNVENALTGPDGAILESMHGPLGQDGSHGLAVYVPAPGSYLSAYTNLALTKTASEWPQFLKDQSQ